MGGIMNQWWRLGGVCGIAFIVLFIACVSIQGEPPMYDDPISEIRAYWTDDGNTFLVSDYILGLGALLLYLPFLCALRALFGVYEGGAQLWSRVAFAAGIVFLTMVAVAGTAWTTLAYATEALDDESVKLLMFFDHAAFNSTAFPMGALLLASSLVIWQTGVLWKWLAIVGAILGIVTLITPLSLLDKSQDLFDILGFISFIGFAVWLLIVSIAMVMKREVVSMGARDADAAARQPAGM